MQLTTLWAHMSARKKARFAKLSNTTQEYIAMQLLGGHRVPSLRMMWAMVLASKRMYPKTPINWLSLDSMYAEIVELRERRAGMPKRTNQPGASV